MNLLEIKGQIFSVLIKSGYFSLSEHLDTIDTPAEVSKVKDAIIVSAMDDLVKADIVKKVEDKDSIDKFWVLISPIESLSQKVELSPMVTESIGETIDNFSEAIGNGWGKTDRTNINESNIVSLLQIIGFLVEDNEEGDDKVKEFKDTE